MTPFHSINETCGDFLQAQVKGMTKKHLNKFFNQNHVEIWLNSF